MLLYQHSIFFLSYKEHMFYYNCCFYCAAYLRPYGWSPFLEIKAADPSWLWHHPRRHLQGTFAFQPLLLLLPTTEHVDWKDYF